MADAQDVARDLLEKMQRYSAFLDELFIKVVKRVGAQIESVKTFFDQLAAAAAELGRVVAKGAVDAAVTAIRSVFSAMDFLRSRVRVLRRLAQKVIALLQRGLNDVGAVAGRVVKLVKRFRKDYAAVLESVVGLIASSAPVMAVLSLLRAARRVLSAMFDWVGDVSSAASTMRKLKKLVKPMRKEIKVQMRELQRLPRALRELSAV